MTEFAREVKKYFLLTKALNIIPMFFYKKQNNFAYKNYINIYMHMYTLTKDFPSA